MPRVVLLDQAAIHQPAQQRHGPALVLLPKAFAARLPADFPRGEESIRAGGQVIQHRFFFLRNHVRKDGVPLPGRQLAAADFPFEFRPNPSMLRFMAKPALGRGLGALLGGAVSTARNAVAGPPPAAASAPAPTLPVGESVVLVSLAHIQPSPLQPRKEFPAEALQELADSIREKGIVQPLLVRRRDNHLELIAGERRWRAAQLAGLAQVPVIVRLADDRTTLELALIENLQRENLNPIEEAAGYRQLIDQFDLSQEAAAAKVGKSRVAVANALRLLSLPPKVRDWVREGRLSVGHAKVILGLPAAQQQEAAAEQTLKAGLTVRQLEELVAHWATKTVGSPSGDGAPAAPSVSRDPHVVSLEGKLRERFGTKVGLRYRKGRGSIEIRFFSDDELERLLEIVGVKVD